MNIEKKQSLVLRDKFSDSKIRKNKLVQDQQNKLGK